MARNTFGHLFQITSFGESHGEAMGVVIDGCPAGVKVDDSLLDQWMQRRRPGQSQIVTDRNEKDQTRILSGVYQQRTIGSPICVVVENANQKSEDYSEIKLDTRKGHADDVWREKFGHSDLRGGGRASGRETLSRVIGAAFAQMFLQQSHKIQVCGFTKKIFNFESQLDPSSIDPKVIESHPTRFPEANLDRAATELLMQAKQQGESYGGLGAIYATGIPRGLGQPVFNKLKSDLASAMLSIGATTSFSFGDALALESEGSEFHGKSDQKTYGGIRGGISTGEPIYFEVGFKPTSSVLDIAKKGRHDPCIIPRAVPVLEAMTWLVLADHILWARLDKA